MISPKEEARKFKKAAKGLLDERKLIQSEMEKEYLNEEGEASISIDLSNEEELFDSYSGGTLLNPDVYEYLDEAASFVSITKPLNINITLDSTDEKFESKVRSTYKAHYMARIIKKGKQLKKNAISGAVLMVIGVILLVLNVSLGKLIDNFILSEIVSVASCMLMWESVDHLVLISHGLREERNKLVQMAMASIGFGIKK